MRDPLADISMAKAYELLISIFSFYLTDDYTPLHMASK